MNLRPPSHLLIAWLASAFALAFAFVAWMFITVKTEGSPLPKNVMAVGLYALAAGLIIQLVYGGLVYLVLNRFAIFTFWAVLAAYLLPVLLFSVRASDTYQDILGTIPWAVFASLVAVVSWGCASGRWLSGSSV